MLQANHPANQLVPEIVRMKAQRGFFAYIDGKLSAINPGDVVDLPRQLAFDMRGAGKAFMVDEPLKRQKDYVAPWNRPEFAGAGSDPVTRQLVALTAAVTALVKQQAKA